MRIALPALAAALAFAAAAQTAPSADDAWPLYQQAAARILEGINAGTVSPSASNVEYPDLLAFPPAWRQQAKAAYDFDTPALDAVHRAATLKVAHWPVVKNGNDVDLRYLNGMRNVANGVADAALYEHVQGDDAAALGRVRDLLHAADLLDDPNDELVVQALVSVGLRAIALNRVEIIAADLHVAEATGKNVVTAAEVKGLIKQLFTNDVDPTPRVTALLAHEDALGLNRPPMSVESLERIKLTLRRIQMERNLAAMSLACRLYHFEKSSWPSSIADVQRYLPAAPVDAWGPMGYLLLKAGRPDGGDRPLVYSRSPGEGPLAYRTDEPQFGFYLIDPGARPPVQARGQFRDVSLWLPAKFGGKATTREVPE